MKKTKRIIALLTAVLCISFLLPQGAAAAPANAADPEWEVLQRTNDERAKEGLVPLTTSASLQNATDIRAEEIAEVFSHTRPDGTACFTVLEEQGIRYSGAAENIAAGQSTATQVVNGWMNSAGHRANIMNGRLRHMGVGFYRNHWVQLFVSGCTATAIRTEGTAPSFDSKGNLLTEDAALAVDCTLHGTSYLPLVNADYTFNGNNTFTVRYDGVTATLPANVGFSDVPADAWFADEVSYVSQKGWMNGIDGGRFDPNGSMSRAMMVTVLHRMSGSPAAAGASGFSDVPTETWYTEAVSWAAENGIINGIGNNRFDPAGLITREQMATLLYRYAQNNGADTSTLQNLDTFADSHLVADWSKTAMRWSVAKGLINGIPVNGRTHLSPQGLASRAEAAAILMRYDTL